MKKGYTVLQASEDYGTTLTRNEKFTRHFLQSIVG